MEQKQDLSLSLTPIELYFLAGLLEITMLVGVGDPLFGWLREESEEALIKARETLVMRGLLLKNNRNDYIVDTIAAGIVALLSSPKTIFVVDVKPSNGDGRVSILHVESDLFMYHVFHKDFTQELDFHITDKQKIAVGWILKDMDLGEAQDTSSGTINMTMADLWKTIEELQLGNDRRCKGIRMAKGDNEDKKLLIETLSSLNKVSSLICISREEDEYNLEGIAFLGSRDYLWKIVEDFRNEEINIKMNICGKLKAEEGAAEFFLKRASR